MEPLYDKEVTSTRGRARARSESFRSISFEKDKCGPRSSSPVLVEKIKKKKDKKDKELKDQEKGGETSYKKKRRKSYTSTIKSSLQPKTTPPIPLIQSPQQNSTRHTPPQSPGSPTTSTSPSPAISTGGPSPSPPTPPTKKRKEKKKSGEKDRIPDQVTSTVSLSPNPSSSGTASNKETRKRQKSFYLHRSIGKANGSKADERGMERVEREQTLLTNVTEDVSRTKSDCGAPPANTDKQMSPSSCSEASCSSLHSFSFDSPSPNYPSKTPSTSTLFPSTQPSFSTSPNLPLPHQHSITTPPTTTSTKIKKTKSLEPPLSFLPVKKTKSNDGSPSLKTADGGGGIIPLRPKKSTRDANHYASVCNSNQHLSFSSPQEPEERGNRSVPDLSASGTSFSPPTPQHQALPSSSGTSNFTATRRRRASVCQDIGLDHLLSPKFMKKTKMTQEYDLAHPSKESPTIKSKKKLQKLHSSRSSSTSIAPTRSCSPSPPPSSARPSSTRPHPSPPFHSPSFSRATSHRSPSHPRSNTISSPHAPFYRSTSRGANSKTSLFPPKSPPKKLLDSFAAIETPVPKRNFQPWETEKIIVFILSLYPFWKRAVNYFICGFGQFDIKKSAVLSVLSSTLQLEEGGAEGKKIEKKEEREEEEDSGFESTGSSSFSPNPSPPRSLDSLSSTSPYIPNVPLSPLHLPSSISSIPSPKSPKTSPKSPLCFSSSNCPTSPNLPTSPNANALSFSSSSSSSSTTTSNPMVNTSPNAMQHEAAYYFLQTWMSISGYLFVTHDMKFMGTVFELGELGHLIKEKFLASSSSVFSLSNPPNLFSCSEMGEYTQEDDLGALLRMELFEGRKPAKIAKVVTFIMSNVFRRVGASEMYDGAWQGKRKHKTAPNLHKLSLLFNRLSALCAIAILQAPEEQRGDILEKTIKLAYKMREMNNFEGMASVGSIFNWASIKRLKPLWDGISKKTRMKLNEVQRLLDPSNNYEAMSKCLSQLQADGEHPYIPLIAPNLRGLRYLYDSRDKMNKDGSIDFQFMMKVGEMIYNLLQNKENVHKLHPPQEGDALCELLETEMNINVDAMEDALFEKSEKIYKKPQ